MLDTSAKGGGLTLLLLDQAASRGARIAYVPVERIDKEGGCTGAWIWVGWGVLRALCSATISYVHVERIDREGGCTGVSKMCRGG